MGKSRIQISRPDIIRYFDELPERVFRKKEVARHLAQQREFWRLTQGTTVEAFIKFLMDSAKLSKVTFPFPKPYKREVRYAWGEVPMRTVTLTLKPDCYFSHYTAMQLNGLTEQVPKTTYLNDEQRLESWLSGTLSQRTIDAAFRRPVRVTKYVAETKDFRICIVSGKNTGKFGVIEQEIADEALRVTSKMRLTNIERTLVDIAVRPVYSGGVAEVLKAYELARETVSVNRLAATLKTLAYIYPYHQVIGFYLERAGYGPSFLDLFREIPMKFDFYLTHGMGETEYVKPWRLFIPKGF